MRQTVVVSEPLGVEQELAQLGMTLEIGRKVALGASAAKASALDIDVAFARGMFSHIYGHRYLRLALLPLGWLPGRFNNVESVINHELGIQIIFQNVDVACDPIPENYPRAISGKGAGSRDLIQAGNQGELWEIPVESQGDINNVQSKLGVTPQVWMFCFSDDGKRVRAEISQPMNFEGDQFEYFSKRIFILDENIEGDPLIEINGSPDADGEMDFDIKVVRK